MSNFLIALILVLLGVVVVVHAGAVLFTGKSNPPVPMEKKAFYYKRVPATSPISP